MRLTLTNLRAQYPHMDIFIEECDENEEMFVTCSIFQVIVSVYLSLRNRRKHRTLIVNMNNVKIREKMMHAGTFRMLI